MIGIDRSVTDGNRGAGHAPNSEQLEAELREGAWVVTPATEDLVFDRRPDTLWRRILRRLGGDWAALADEPPDPTWN